MDNNRNNNSGNIDHIPDLDLDVLNEILEQPQEEVAQPQEEVIVQPQEEITAQSQEVPVIEPTEELIFGEEDKVTLFDEPEEDDDMIMIFDEIETDLTEVNDEEEDDDLVFIDAVSVRDRRKINTIQMVDMADEADVEKKKTRRRNNDVNEIKIERHLNFAKKNIVMLGIGALVLVIIIGVIVVGVKTFKENHSSVPKISAGAESYQVEEQEAINALMTEYYTAVADNDTYVLNEILNPVFDNEMEYIHILTEYVDSYNNIVCYAKDGMEEGDYIVAVYYEVKYKKVKNSAPGMQFFYLETNADGDLYINNLYSEHNMVYVEAEPNADVMYLMSAYQTEASMQSLVAQVQDNYDQAISSNEDLNQMITVTLPEALKDWSATMEAYLNVQPEVPEVVPETPVEGETTDPLTGVTETAAEGIVYANDNVNIRQAPSTDAAKVASIYAGAEVRRLATTDNGWTKVQTGDVTGYIRSDFIAEEKPAGTDGNGAGNTITVQDTTNIRASKSTESDLVEVVTAGGTVTILEGDSDGWTKVSYNGTTGYIRSDVLQ